MKKQLHKQKQKKAEDQSPVKFDRRAEISSDFLFARNIQNTTKQKEESPPQRLQKHKHGNVWHFFSEKFM